MGFALISSWALLFGGQPPLQILALLSPLLSGLIRLVVKFIPDVDELVLRNVKATTLASVSLSGSVVE